MIARLLERRWFTPCLFLALGLAVYWNGLSAGYVAWDDTYLVTRNPLVRSLTFTTLSQAFSTYDPELYIPLTFVSYQLTHLVAGASPFAVHSVNLLLHIVNATLVASLLGRWLRRDIAVLCGITFLLHPIHTEAVLWASARKDVLSALFFFLALGSTLKPWDTGKWPHAGIAWFTAGLLSKVTVFTLPVILLVEALLQRRPWRRTVLPLTPYIALSCLFGVIALAGKQHVTSALTVTQRVALALQSTAATVQHALFPNSLSPIYEVHRTVGLFTQPTLTAALVCIALVALAWKVRKRNTAAALGIAIFYIAYAPSFLTFSKGASIMLTSDRYAYLPSIGLLLAAGSLLSPLLRGQRTTLAGLAMVAVLGTLSFRQARIWRDTPSLFGHALKLDPLSVHAGTNLGVFLTQQGRLTEAENVLRDIAEKRPLSGPLVALGTVLEAKGDALGALQAFSGAIAAEPQDPGAHFAYADAMVRRGNREAAIAALRSVLTINPSHTPAMQNLGALLLERGEIAEAEMLLRRAVELNPYYSDAWFNLGLLLERSDRDALATDAFTRSLEGQPSLAPALENVIPTLVSTRRASEAALLLHRAIEANPQHAGNAALALSTLKELLRTEPNNTEAKALLDALFRLGVVQRRP